MSKAKVLSLEELADKAAALRRDGKRLVMCHGTFDLLHAGHIRHLQRARQEADVLMVTLTGDAHVNTSISSAPGTQKAAASHGGTTGPGPFTRTRACASTTSS